MMGTGCSEFKLGGVIAKQAFDDPVTADMVAHAAKGRNQRVTALIDEGADVNAVGKDELTPLAWVLASGHLDTAELLLQQGADANYRMSSGESLMAMVAGGDSVDRLRLLLNYNGDANARGRHGRPITLYAIENFRPRNLRLLLERGANVNAHTPDGRESAATGAATLNQFDTVLYLLDQGYNFDLRHLAQTVSIGTIAPGSHQCQARGEVLTVLQKKGVQFQHLDVGAADCRCLHKLRSEGNEPAAFIIAAAENAAENRAAARPANDRQAREKLSTVLEKIKDNDSPARNPK